MPQVVIENPILNSSFKEPARHFKFSDDGITDEVVESRRISTYFVPIAKPRKKAGGKQLALDTEWTQDRVEENKDINRIRERVSIWRKGNYAGITNTTRQLLEYWTNPDRERKLFFCQIEAMETAIYLAEVANKYGDNWIENSIRDFNEANNPGLYRIAFKMATGSGKTVVMAMLIAWQVLNKIANPQDARFTDAFLIVTPGITIRDRLRVLYPNDPQNYYQQRDVVSLSQMADLGRARIIITNFHTFNQRELEKAGRLTKAILANGQTSSFTETPDQMVRRVCRELGSKKNIIIINDEAHHCYRHKVEAEELKLTGDDRRESEKREEEARVWISGLEAVKKKIGIKVIYDLSATPFFLRGSGYSEGTLFPWVVSDFSLIDAIECGIVKVPRVPVSDDSMQGEMPTYRDIWLRIRDHLPKKGRGTKDESATGDPNLPKELEGALISLYGNYEKYYRQWEQNTEARERGATPPVFIVVCNNTNVSKLVYDWISGYQKNLSDGNEIVVPGNLSIFSNVDTYGQWLSIPNTILIDSAQLESGEAMSKEFKKMADVAIAEFKDYYRQSLGHDPEKLTDEDLLREVMNTVGKTGKLGENVRCVVSVSMLTEGWDAQTVTHIMGARAFSTQLLCEQVVGRALRRRSYDPTDGDKFEAEYAEVYGVPFSFIPCAGQNNDIKSPRPITRVRALNDRIACEITFPRVSGYKYDLPPEKLEAVFTEDSKMVLSTEATPTRTDNAPIVGETSIHTLDDLKIHREQEVVFHLARTLLDKYFNDADGNVKPWLFPQLVNIARQWMSRCVTIKDNAFIQMLLITENAHFAAERIYTSIAGARQGQVKLRPILRPYDATGSTRYVDFDTTRAVYPSDPNKCHISHVVADTESWEQKMAQALEEMDEVICYVKNQGLEFTIPYVIDGNEKKYYPDFIVRLRRPDGDLINLIVEVTGEKKREKAAKVAAARNLWVPAVNNHGELGKWAFIEISDPWDAKNTIRAYLEAQSDGVLNLP